MAIADDFTVALNGDIRYVGGGSTYYTVLELHRFLMDLADDAEASGNDLVDITSTKPSDRSTDNIITLVSPYNIDKDASEQLYDGSILQEDGDTLFSGLVVVGEVETGTQLQVIRNNAEVTSWWGTGINMDAANNILMRTLIQTRNEGVDIDFKKIRVQAREFNDEYAEFSVTLGLGNATAAIFTGSDLNNQTAQATVNGWDCSNTEGYQLIDLNNGNGSQPYYSKWDLGSRTLINDIYEWTKNIQRRGTSSTIHTMNGKLFRGITHEWAYDAESGNFQEDEVLAWGCSFNYDGQTVNLQVGERLDFSVSNAVGILIAQDDNGATGTLYIQVVSGTPADGNVITGYTSSGDGTVDGTVNDVGATSGTGILLALDDNGATGTMWIQLLTGSPPVDDLPVYGGTSEKTCLVNGSVTSRSRAAEFYGASTGTSIIGNHGIGHLPGDLLAADKLFDLLGALQQPPNQQSYFVYGLVVGEDRIVVCKNDGSDEIDYDQYTLNGDHNSGTQTTITVNGAISGETPASGTIRIEKDSDGTYTYQTYTSWTGSVFTIPSTDYSGNKAASSGNNCFCTYIDKLATGTTESFTGIYTSDVSMVIKVRDGGTAGDQVPIKPWKSPITFGSGGGSITATRISDA